MITAATTRREAKSLRLEAQARIDAAHTEGRQHVARGTCPACGTPLRRNLALTGWWQCGAYGVPGFRRPEDREKPHCSFQCFTE